MYRVVGTGKSGIDGIGEENERGASSWRRTVEKNEVKFLDSGLCKYVPSRFRNQRPCNGNSWRS